MKETKNVLIILNYYVPYMSGLTEYARLSAEYLVAQGYRVTVLTSNHANLEPFEIINGVEVHRAKVLFKIGKGTISIEYLLKAAQLAKKADRVNLHLPMLEAGLISLLIKKEKLVTMYHCDVNLSQSLVDKLITRIMDFSHSICLSRSSFVNVTSIDYATHSRVASKFTQKLIDLGAPIKEYNKVVIDKASNYKTIGFLGRIVEEKGIDVLIKAFEILKASRKDIRLLIGGDYMNIAGGSVYPKLMDYITKHQIKDIEFVGRIREEEVEKFFSAMDVFALPSTNSLEAFGLVQLEAMRCGVPVVASDLYGVRTIIQKTGGGQICKAGDVASLVEALNEVLDHKEKYTRTLDQIEMIYSNKIWGKTLENSLK